MATEEPLPRGVGRLPEWWMEITPHHNLNFEDDETRRHEQEAEAKMLARAAALQDLQQKYGGEGFPDWNPSKHGPRSPEEEKEWAKSGWKRLSNDEWVDDQGKPLEGRQFSGKLPAGYRPGEFEGAGGYYDPAKFGPGGSGAPGQGGLNSTGGYGRDAELNWEKPVWTKVKLRSTGAGNAIRGGNYGAVGKGKAGGAAPAAEAPSPTEPEPQTEPGPGPEAEPAPAPQEEVEEEEEEVEEEEEEADGTNGLKQIKRIRRKRVSKKVVAAPESNEPAWVKARREKAEAAEVGEKAEAAEVVEETEYEEEVVEEEIIEEEYEEEIIEEIIVEDEHGNEIVEEDGPTLDVTDLQNVLAKRLNEEKLL